MITNNVYMNNERFDLKTFSYNYNHRHDEVVSNYIAIDAKSGMNTMKIYLVCDMDYYYPRDIIKGVTSLQKAFDYATDTVMEHTTKYNRDYVRKVIEKRYDQVDIAPDLFVYTDHHDMGYDRYITIKEIDVDL